MTSQTQQSQPVTERKKGFTWKHVQVIVTLLLAGLVVLFIAKNAHPVEFWLFGMQNSSLIVLMLSSLAAGAMLVGLVGALQARRKKEIHRLRDEVKRLQEALSKKAT